MKGDPDVFSSIIVHNHTERPAEPIDSKQARPITVSLCVEPGLNNTTMLTVHVPHKFELPSHIELTQSPNMYDSNQLVTSRFDTSNGSCGWESMVSEEYRPPTVA